MATFKDDAGNEVTAFTQEEVQAQIAAAVEEAKKTTTKTEGAAPVAIDVEAIKAEILKSVEEKTNAVRTEVKSEKLQAVKSALGSELDADARKVYEAKFDSLTVGYEDTPEGYQARARDAYLLATGKPPAVDFGLSNMMAPMAKSTVKSSQTTETDRAIRAALGITEADAEKYGKK
jgi:hypothetical protein